MLTLRDYQKQAIDAVFHDWQRGITDSLLVMATGCGKTAVFCATLDRALTDGKRGMILAHRKELIDQPVARMTDYFPAWRDRVGVVMADTHQPDRQLIVATVQSLAASPRRLNDVLASGPIDYLVTDEAHHATSPSYRKVYEALRAVNPGLLHLGVTATPIRADGDGLAGVFQNPAFVYNIVQGIHSGNLAPVRWLAIQTKISVGKIATVGGDFNQGQLKNVFETDNCFDLVVETHKKYASGRQALAFTVTVEGAHALAAKFNEAGIAAAAADGATDKTTRAQVLADFTAGKIQVLCNVGLYTEGLDVPQASCIHNVRPTKSDALYVQMVGRALRTYPGKLDALVLDYAPAENRNIVMAGDILGVPLEKRQYVKPADETEEGDAAAGFLFDGNDFQYLSGNPAELISRQIDYLNLSPWSWYRRDGWMSLGLGEASDGKERTLVVSPPENGQMTLYGVAKAKQDRFWVGYKIRVGTWDSLSLVAEDYANRFGNASLAAKARSWRNRPATDGQIRFARTIKGAYIPGVKCGEQAQLITHYLAVREVQSGTVMDLTGRK